MQNLAKNNQNKLQQLNNKIKSELKSRVWMQIQQEIAKMIWLWEK